MCYDNTDIVYSKLMNRHVEFFNRFNIKIRCRLVKNNNLSVFDEPTANLDVESIELIGRIETGERTVIKGRKQQDIKIFYRFVGEV